MFSFYYSNNIAIIMRSIWPMFLSSVEKHGEILLAFCYLNEGRSILREGAEISFMG